jgi:subtilisin family serine protease
VKLFGEAVRPPRVGYSHLRLPRGLTDALNAATAHASGITGAGVRVAVCDTGFYRHPWFARFEGRVRVLLTPGAANPQADEVGHGTVVVANLLSVAPRCVVTVIKMNFAGTGSFSEDAVAALTMAEASRADIINCSWGCSLLTAADAASAHTRTLEYLLARLAAGRRVVVCAAGNFPRQGRGRGEFGFPAQHPDVIAVGGARPAARGRLRAASYASAFRSEIYSYRDVPDVCGVCGDLPAGVLIMSPVQPGCVMDREAAQRRYPNGDNTAADDGWCCVSGTSSAAPQVSGTAALLLESHRQLRHTATIRALLQLSARDVTAGHSNVRAARPGVSIDARRGPDLATGAGLVDVSAAVTLARWMAKRTSGRRVAPR